MVQIVAWILFEQVESLAETHHTDPSRVPIPDDLISAYLALEAKGDGPKSSSERSRNTGGPIRSNSSRSESPPPPSKEGWGRRLTIELFSIIPGAVAAILLLVPLYFIKREFGFSWTNFTLFLFVPLGPVFAGMGLVFLTLGITRGIYRIFPGAQPL